MIKYALLASLALPVLAHAADYSGAARANCRLEQSGNGYCTVRPIEKRITNCDPGVDCRHMESGAHYSVQAPVVPRGYFD